MDSDEQYLVTGLIIGCIIGVILGLALGRFTWSSPMLSVEQEQAYGKRFCSEHGYDAFEDVRIVKQKYYVVACSRIKDYSYVIDEFDIYPEELKNYGTG